MNNNFFTEQINMNKQIVAVLLVLCLAVSTMAQGDFMLPMLLMRSMQQGQGASDAQTAQATNSLPGAQAGGSPMSCKSFLYL